MKSAMRLRRAPTVRLVGDLQPPNGSVHRNARDLGAQPNPVEAIK
jgi:hypothetical protein